MPLKSLDYESITTDALAGYGLSILISGEFMSGPEAALNNFDGVSVLSER